MTDTPPARPSDTEVQAAVETLKALAADILAQIDALKADISAQLDAHGAAIHAKVAEIQAKLAAE